MIFVAHNNSPKVLQPRKQAFNLPTAFVTPELSAILRFGSLAIDFVRRNQLNIEFFQLFIQRIAVIGFITDYSFRSFVGEPFRNSSFGKFDFVWRSRFCVDGERKTKAVCHCHELRTLAPLGFSNFEPPFLADTNVPSINASDRSSLPRSNKSWAKVSNTFFSLPSRPHSWKRRWHVWYGGKRSGKSAQRAPERKIHNTPFNISRADRCGLPRVWISLAFSNNGAIKAHCSSVNSSRRAIREVYQTIFEMASTKAALIYF